MKSSAGNKINYKLKKILLTLTPTSSYTCVANENTNSASINKYKANKKNAIKLKVMFSKSNVFIDP